jgi:hypothetical protein
MDTSKDDQMDKGFVPGGNYKFDPPVLANCCSVLPHSMWTQKSFATGICLRYDAARSAYAFQGKPGDDDFDHFFLVEFGKGSVAQKAPPPHLCVVK